mmetsp:Transcript_22336/g.37366  ORF Transcript_22336/g.37366 Transcript_22336/m.37366 type:complete len:194 (-) Transcript_22336:295-876(-)|eukprot:CAMPEP_0174972286 /NCGR_PEP_ID=MMETSP0004_2-20121128/10537_1 /TAXON_ID=420556 /ORGANISM="Ochromonas sp., Strain CCMP1393" /LENGTH=193 /DNA_ID=CAMNT_0016222477 /DNA_START=108 /DNA_END=689 /DNA_ORIENTATION=-
MDGVSLPVINSAASENNILYSNNNVPIDVIEEEGNKFDLDMDHLATIPFPAVDSNSSMKNRINCLEITAERQAEHNNVAHQTFTSLSNNVKHVDENIKSLLLSMQNDFDQRLAQLKKEYDHRFELQSSENKRLQSNVASLKADSNQLKRKMQSTIEKLRKLQTEFGDPDMEEESSVIFSTTGGIDSRPNTTGY